MWLYQRPQAGSQMHRAVPVWAQRLLVRLPLRGATGVSIPSVGRKMKEEEKEAYRVGRDPKSGRQDTQYSRSHLGM